MALFRRTKSPRDQRHHVTPTPLVASKEKEAEKLVSGHRRHKSDDHIVVAVDPSIFDQVPPELPPRNRFDSSGGSFSFSTNYRRTQSSGTMSASFNTPGHAAKKPQEDYFVPADTLRNMSSVTAPKLQSQDKRIMIMHDKILSHNAPDSHKPRCISFERLVDISDYSVPFEAYEKGQPPVKPKRSSNKVVKETTDSSGLINKPPDYLPPPPPPLSDDEEPVEHDRSHSVSPHLLPNSPSVSITRGGDYDDPWDSSKFMKIRQRADTEPPKRLGGPFRIDPYRSPKGSHNELTEPEPPLPPKPTDSSARTTPDLNDSQLSSSPTPPPVPDSSRPRASTGESDYCEPPDSVLPHNEKSEGGYYVNYRTLHDGEGYMHDYVNQPACPPKLPPRPSIKKQHGYPQLEPPDISHPPDIQPLLPPAFPIDVSIVLEEQPWYHGRIGRDQAEDILRNQPEFSFLVRNSESCRMDYSLSIRDGTSPAAHGFIHLKISSGIKGFVLGQFSSFFRSVPECIGFYTQQPLTIRNINHRRLGFPVGRIQFTHH